MHPSTASVRERIAAEYYKPFTDCSVGPKCRRKFEGKTCLLDVYRRFVTILAHVDLTDHVVTMQRTMM